MSVWVSVDEGTASPVAAEVQLRRHELAQSAVGSASVSAEAQVAQVVVVLVVRTDHVTSRPTCRTVAAAVSVLVVLAVVATPVTRGRR